MNSLDPFLCLRRNWLVLASLLPLSAAGQVDDDPVRSLSQVNVVSQTPLPGLDMPLAQYPGHAQQADDAAIERAGGSNLADFLNRQFTGVTVAGIQGNPYQVDLSYRGHRLSPMLGSPQGLSVYLDGVRVNQPFGDVMDWEMLPEMALAGVTLVPGSSPLYGLNTLGGALVLTTKSGRTHPGTELDVSVGSAGRRRLEFGHGARWEGGWHGYVAGTLFDEDGWRDRSPGRLGQMFLKWGRDQGDTSWSLSYALGRSHLTGNGLLSQGLYDINRRAGYTFSDVTHNRSGLLNFQFTRALTPDDDLSVVAWHRGGRRRASHGDVSESWAQWLEACEDSPQAAACTRPEDPGYVRNSAVFNRGEARQSEVGASAQWTHRSGIHQWALGAELARSRTRYDQDVQEAVFDADRTAVPVPGSAAEHEVALRGSSGRLGLFAADTVSLGEKTRLSLSARWNASRVRNDLGHPAPLQRESFRYRQLNPAIGISHDFSGAVTGFASLSQGSRMPTALELGCADPDKPCTLPVGLQSDPYLKQVIARTLEVGARVQPAEGVQLSGALFRTVSRDDIVFVRAGASQAGYFTNVPETRRQGLELSARVQRGAWEWQAGYSYLDATYQSSGVLPGPLSTESRPNAFGPGTRMTGLPRHVLKLSVDWRAAPGVSLGGDWLAFGSQVVAGNESGTRPELGKVAGFGIVNLRAHWQFSERWKAYLRVNNLLNKAYATYGSGNEDLFPGGQAARSGDEVGVARFLAPGMGRAITVGLRYEWGR
jgi:outer membrane receptor protein involved in Fe transport